MKYNTVLLTFPDLLTSVPTYNEWVLGSDHGHCPVLPLIDINNLYFVPVFCCFYSYMQWFSWDRMETWRHRFLYPSRSSITLTSVDYLQMQIEFNPSHPKCPFDIFNIEGLQVWNKLSWPMLKHADSRDENEDKNPMFTFSMLGILLTTILGFLDSNPRSRPGQ